MPSQILRRNREQKGRDKMEVNTEASVIAGAAIEFYHLPGGARLLSGPDTL